MKLLHYEYLLTLDFLYFIYMQILITDNTRPLPLFLHVFCSNDRNATMSFIEQLSLPKHRATTFKFPVILAMKR